MIRKLKLKLILIIMAIAAMMLTAVFGFIYFSTANRLESESLNAMKDRMSRLVIGEPILKSTASGYSIFDISYNANTGWLTINNTSGYLNKNNLEAEASELIEKAYSNTEDIGVIKGTNLRYYKTISGSEVRVVFLDKSSEDLTLRNMLASIRVIGILAIIGFLIVSIVLADIAVAPVARSIRQQKQLVSDMSHELKTPITVISANVDIMLQHSDETVAEQEKWLNYIKIESSRMANLINNMLYLSKTEETRANDSKHILSLSNTVTSAALPFESVCFEKSKEFELYVQPEVYINGNESSVKQIVGIFTDNAIKYSGEGGKIVLSVRAENDKAIFSVWNSGEPIPPAKQEHIFERFYRADKSRVRNEGGFGLGLSIAKTIADSHGAKLTVSSTEAKGTVFSCIFKKMKSV